MKTPDCVQQINLFVSDARLVWVVCCHGVCVPCMLACLCRCYLPALDSNDTECTEEGEAFEYQEEDHGQAIKASHLNLLHIWSQFYLLHGLLLFMKMHGYMLLLP
jgi:hypothetical protein